MKLNMQKLPNPKSEHKKYSDEELLNLAMNQLYRAARTIDLLKLSQKLPQSIGCDWSADMILERLKKTTSGLQLVKDTNRTLLEQEHFDLDERYEASENK